MRVVVDADVRGPLAQLGGMRQRAESSQLMQLLATDLEDYERRQFATSGEGSWAPDDSDTIEQKGSARTLVDEGNLLRHLTTARIVGDSAIVDQGSSFYGSFLRDGDRGMPRRNPAPAPSQRQVQSWADHVLGYIVNGTR